MAYTLNKTNGDVVLVLNDGVGDGPSFPIKTTSINFLGKNLSNFGDAQNENFLWLLENFANVNQPNNPQKGQIWFDSNTNVFRPAVFDGNNWRALAVLQYSNTTTDALINNGQTPFVANNPGDMWFDSTNKQLYVITSTASEKILIGPEVVPGYAITKMVSTLMYDNSNGPRPVIQATLNGEIIGVLSNAAFTPNSIGVTLGFPTINRGLTFKNSTSTSDTTISSSVINATNLFAARIASTNVTITNLTATNINSSVVNGNSFVGTSANITSIQSTNVLASSATITSLSATTAKFSQAYDTGARVLTTATIGSYGISSLTGTANQVTVSNSIGAVQISLPNAVYVNELYDNNARVLTTATIGSYGVSSIAAGAGINITQPQGAAVITNTGVLSLTGTVNQIAVNASTGNIQLSLPNEVRATALYDNGARVVTTATFGSVGVTGITGTANQITVTAGINGSTQISLPNTVAIKKLLGGGTANTGTISGTWTLDNGSTLQATYADLAECYQADAAYEPGTVLEFGGACEVTVAEDGTRKVAGIVSTNPAHVMNVRLTGANVVKLALQGRVPCKIRGKVSKGDMMVSAGDGYARAEYSPILGSIIGKALEDFNGISGVIEVVVGRL